MAFAFWWYCVRGPMIIAAPVLLVASVLAMRAYPTRPVLVGALCGLAAGLLADSGWRLFCEVSSPSHVLIPRSRHRVDGRRRSRRLQPLSIVSTVELNGIRKRF